MASSLSLAVHDRCVALSPVARVGRRTLPSWCRRPRPPSPPAHAWSARPRSPPSRLLRSTAVLSICLHPPWALCRPPPPPSAIAPSALLSPLLGNSARTDGTSCALNTRTFAPSSDTIPAHSVRLKARRRPISAIPAPFDTPQPPYVARRDSDTTPFAARTKSLVCAPPAVYLRPSFRSSPVMYLAPTYVCHLPCCRDSRARQSGAFAASPNANSAHSATLLVRAHLRTRAICLVNGADNAYMPPRRPCDTAC